MTMISKAATQFKYKPHFQDRFKHLIKTSTREKNKHKISNSVNC